MMNASSMSHLQVHIGLTSLSMQIRHHRFPQQSEPPSLLGPDRPLSRIPRTSMRVNLRTPSAPSHPDLPACDESRLRTIQIVTGATVRGPPTRAAPIPRAT